MKRIVSLMLLILSLISCNDEKIDPNKYTMPAQLVTSRNQEGIILAYYATLARCSQSLNLYTPNVVPIEKAEILHSEDDTLDFKVIHTTQAISEQFLFKTSEINKNHYFRLKAYGKNASPYISSPIHVQFRFNPSIHRLIELPFDYTMQSGNFSPDGNLMVYSRNYKWQNGGSCCEDYSIITLNPDNTIEEFLYANAFYPQWAPEDNLIAFHSTFSNNKNSNKVNIGIFNTKEDSVIQITTGENRFEAPVWHPDGKSILFLSYNESKYQLWDVYSLNLSTGVYEILVHDPAFGVLHERLSFSPGGTRLAYSAFDVTDHQNIYALRMETKQIEPLVESIWIDRHPSFSPDGKYLAFLSYRSGKDEIWLRNLTSGELIQFTGDHNAFIDSELVWSPDSRHLYFKANTNEKFGIYFAEIE